MGRLAAQASGGLRRLRMIHAIVRSRERTTDKFKAKTLKDDPAIGDPPVRLPGHRAGSSRRVNLGAERGTPVCADFHPSPDYRAEPARADGKVAL